MNKILAALSAASVLAIAAPAVGQTYQSQNQRYQNQNQRYQNNGNAYAYGQANTNDRIARLDARINAGVQSGQIGRDEARELRMQLRTISRLERQYSRNGLTQQERADLQQRLRAFRDDLRFAGGGNMGNGQNGGQYGQNDGYNERDDGNYGQGGPYDPAECEYSGGNNRNSGLGGLIDSIFGGNSNSNNGDCDGLRVGQRVSGGLSALPYEFRNQFRDSNGIAYRTDGRNIYQIDTRTSTVLRVYGMNR